MIIQPDRLILMKKVRESCVLIVLIRIHNIGHIHNTIFAQTQFSRSTPQKTHFLKSWEFTFLLKYLIFGVEVKVRENVIGWKSMTSILAHFIGCCIGESIRNFFSYRFDRCTGWNNPAIAQLVEHLTVDCCSYQMVTGSIPVGRIFRISLRESFGALEDLCLIPCLLNGIIYIYMVGAAE